MTFRRRRIIASIVVLVLASASLPAAAGLYGPFFGGIFEGCEPAPSGARLCEVRKASPAEQAGLRAGDVIVRFAGVDIEAAEDIYATLRKLRPETVEIVYLRDAEQHRTQAALIGRRSSRRAPVKA